MGWLAEIFFGMDCVEEEVVAVGDLMKFLNYLSRKGLVNSLLFIINFLILYKGNALIKNKHLEIRIKISLKNYPVFDFLIESTNLLYI